MHDHHSDSNCQVCVERVTCGAGAIPFQLWAIYVILFLESFTWFSESLTFIPYLSEQFHLTDFEAGLAYSNWGIGLTIFTFIAGPIIDKIGFKFSIVLGSILFIAARTIIGMSFNVHLTLWTSYTLYAFASCLITPSITIGTKRYMVDEQEQTSSFSIQYTISNMGAFTGFLAVDWFREEQFKAFINFDMDGLRLLRFVNAFISIGCCGVALIFIFMRKTIYEDAFEERIAKERKAEENSRKGMSWWKKNFEKAREPFSDTNFLRLMLFILVLLGTRAIFKYLDTIFPKYITRALDPNGKYGALLAINPFIIIVFTPIFTSIFSKFSIYPLILVGTTISAASVFFLAVKGTYTTVILFMVIFSIGEAFHGPRANQYAMRVSKDGKEGLYSTLCSLLLFAVKPIVGIFSGYFLETFCPETGERDCEQMWFRIGLMAISTPILLLLLRNILDVKTIHPENNIIISHEVVTPFVKSHPSSPPPLSTPSPVPAATATTNEKKKKTESEIELEIQYWTEDDDDVWDASESSLASDIEQVSKPLLMSDNDFEQAVKQLANPTGNDKTRAHRERKDISKHD